jgi:hypothetical protein
MTEACPRFVHFSRASLCDSGPQDHLRKRDEWPEPPQLHYQEQYGDDERDNRDVLPGDHHVITGVLRCNHGSNLISSPYSIAASISFLRSFDG